MALDTTTIVEKLKILLPIGNTDAYDEELNLRVKSSISKLETEGVKNVYDMDDNLEISDEGLDYIVCISYQVAIDMDFAVDKDRLDGQYITRVNTLRTKQTDRLLRGNSQ